MKCLQSSLYIWILLLQSCNIIAALDCQPLQLDPITVDASGQGKFTTIQSAIDSVPDQNTQWIHIKVSAGKYTEKVAIPKLKSCIFLEGAGRQLTSVEWDDHASTDTSATFSSFPDNILVKGITFKNTHNIPYAQLLQNNGEVVTQALAVRVYGDKSCFTECGFVGVQDTLWDVEGRHLFHKCYIEGAIDFIFGSGQSIYEGCEVSVNVGKAAPEKTYGVITAARRNSPDSANGFVFKKCLFSGTGKAYLGRPWVQDPRVIIARSHLTDVILPEGWDTSPTSTGTPQFVEFNNVGPGADTSKRKLLDTAISPSQILPYLSRNYIDNDGWIANLPGPPLAAAEIPKA